MNGLAISVDISDAVSERVSAFLNGLENRTELNARVADRERNLIRDYFLSLEGTRHDTAMRLGATPSNFWGMAANNTSSHATEAAAVVSVNHPGVGRAMHDVTITPGEGKQWLTIPLIAAAYNQRAYRVPGLFVVPGAAMPLLAKKNEDGHSITPWYALVKSVTQKQDRTLLPSDEALEVEALEGIRDYVDELFANIGAA